MTACVCVLVSMYVTSALWLGWQEVHLHADRWECQWAWPCSLSPLAPPAGH